MTLMDRGSEEYGADPPRGRLSQRWFTTLLGMGAAEHHLKRVLYALSGDTDLDGPRLVDRDEPYKASRRRPDYAASVITGRVNGSGAVFPVDAQVEVRLYDVDGWSVLYVGIAVLGRNHPDLLERELLAQFARQWHHQGDLSLTRTPPRDYAI